MQLQLEKFRGVESASIKLDPKITLFAGKTGGGKSSVLVALRALVTGNALSIKGVKKKDSALFVRGSHLYGGNNKAATIKLDGSTIEYLGYPAAFKAVSGAPLSSDYAAGICKPSEIEAAELIKVLNILPSREDFDKAVEPLHEFDFNADTIWSSIETVGWDDTYKSINKKGVELKRDWAKTAGRDWGSDIGQKFTPPNYTTKFQEDLIAGVDSAEKLFEYACKAEALGQHDKDQLQKIADFAPTAAQQIEALSTELTALIEVNNQALSVRQSLPAAVNSTAAFQCWKCHAYGTIKDGRLIAAQDPKKGEADADAARKAIEAQDVKLKSIATEIARVEGELRAARSAADNAEDARKKLAVADIQVEPSLVTKDVARAELDRARAELKALKIKEECDEIHDLISLNLYLQGILDPDGLRKEVLGKKLADLNNTIAELCAIGEIPTIRYDETLDVYMGSSPYVGLSDGEQIIVDTVLQIAIAKYDGSQFLIIDRFEALDRDQRNTLLTVFLETGLMFAIGCNYTTPDEVPNISDLGTAYWCEAGSVEVLNG